MKKNGAQLLNDANGNYDPNAQVWDEAKDYAPAPEASWPPPPTASYVLDAPFDSDYSELQTLVALVDPKAKIGSGTEFSVRVLWPSEHDQGALGSGGRGAHRFLGP